MTHTKYNQPVRTDPEMTDIIELINKNIKIIIITLFHMFKKLEEILNMLSRNI